MLNFLRKIFGVDSLVQTQLTALQREVELLREFLELERAEKEQYKQLALQTVGLFKQVNESAAPASENPRPVTKARSWNKVRANLELAALEKSWKEKEKANAVGTGTDNI